MQTAECLNHLAPYLFAQIDAKKAALTEQGIDVISLGIGDPDMPTPEHIVDAMAEAIRNPANHQYPDYAGSLAYRQACADYMKRKFDVTLDPKTEVLALIGSKEGIAHLHTAFVNPGDYVLAPAIGYPVYSGGATLQSANTYFMPMNKENGFLADFDHIPEEVLERAKIMFLGYPNNPTVPVQHLSTSTRPSRSAANTTSCSRTTTPTAISATTATKPPLSSNARTPWTAASSSSA